MGIVEVFLLLIVSQPNSQDRRSTSPSRKFPDIWKWWSQPVNNLVPSHSHLLLYPWLWPSKHSQANGDPSDHPINDNDRFQGLPHLTLPQQQCFLSSCSQPMPWITLHRKRLSCCHTPSVPPQPSIYASSATFSAHVLANLHNMAAQ